MGILHLDFQNAPQTHFFNKKSSQSQFQGSRTLFCLKIALKANFPPFYSSVQNLLGLYESNCRKLDFFIFNRPL